MYFARKEQCLALGTQLRTKFKPRIEDYKIYRIYPGGDMEFLHPADGVFPEKVNEGRAMVGCLLYTSPSPRDRQKSRMPSSA